MTDSITVYCDDLPPGWYWAIDDGGLVRHVAPEVVASLPALCGHECGDWCDAPLDENACLDCLERLPTIGVEVRW